VKLAALLRRMRGRREAPEPEGAQPLTVGALPASARLRYLDAWEALQKRFDVEPEAVIRESDRLVQTIMRERGYPTGDFGRVDALLAADQARLLDDYRFAHRISVKAETDAVSENDARRAVAAFGAVFEALLALPESERTSA